MVPDVALILLGGGFAASLVLGWMTLRAGARLALYAHPTVRSFHSRPTPTAGGIAFALPLLGYLVWVASAGSAAAGALAAGGFAIVGLGLWDDVRELPAGWRLAVHAVAAGVFVVAAVPSAAPAWMLLLTSFVLVWHVNLFNFMDGIDGIAATQTLSYAVGAQIVAVGVPGWSGDVLWLAAGAMVAFLVFNWAPARIFMGDVGSGFLGFFTGALAILLWQHNVLPPVTSLILLAAFWLDSGYTLIVRIVTSQPFTQAHRSHLYQKIAARRGHSWTTVYFLLYSTFWLLPIAWVNARYTPEISLTAALWLVPAVLPLAVAAWWYGAGLPDAPVREPNG